MKVLDVLSSGLPDGYFCYPDLSGYFKQRIRILDPDLCPLVTCRYILADTMHIQFDLDTLMAVEEGEGGDKTVLKLQKK